MRNDDDDDDDDAMEILGPINDSARDFLSNLDRKISVSKATIERLAFCFSDSIF